MEPGYRHSLLHDGPIVRIAEILWRADDRRPTAEFLSPRPEITLMRRGIFRKERHDVAADANTVMFFNHREAYRMVHPVPGGCACTAVLIEPAALASIVGEVARRPAGDPGALLAFHHGPCDARTHAVHFELLACLQLSGAGDPLEVEERALSLARDLVHAGHRFHARPRPRLRRDTRRVHADRAEAVKAMLGRRFAERLTLTEIARHVHSAPTHLCTLFKRHTGTTVHRYLTRVRLAAAWDRVLDDRASLAAVALDCGFASPSHFSTAFRNEFGVAPSRLRGVASPRR